MSAVSRGPRWAVLLGAAGVGLLAWAVPVAATAGSPEGCAGICEAEDVSAEEFTVEARRLTLEGNFEGAAAAYDEALRLDPGRADALAGRGYASLMLGRYEAAVADLDAAIAADPDRARSYADRAAARCVLGDCVSALDDLDRAAALDPTDPEIPYLHGNVLLGLGRWREAEAAYDRAIRLDPDFPRAHFERAYARGRLDRPMAALADLDRAAALDPRDAETRYYRGLLLDQLDRAAEALAAWEQALALGFGQGHTARDYEDAIRRVVRALEDAGRPEKAMSYLARILDARPGDAAWLVRRAQLHAALGHPDKALADLAEAVAAGGPGWLEHYRDALATQGHAPDLPDPDAVAFGTLAPALGACLAAGCRLID